MFGYAELSELTLVQRPTEEALELAAAKRENNEDLGMSLHASPGGRLKSCLRRRQRH